MTSKLMLAASMALLTVDAAAQPMAARLSAKPFTPTEMFGNGVAAEVGDRIDTLYDTLRRVGGAHDSQALAAISALSEILPVADVAVNEQAQTLVTALAELGHTPESFAGLDGDRKVDETIKAMERARRDVEAKAALILSGDFKTAQDIDGASREMQRLLRHPLYLSPKTRKKLGKRYLAIQQKRSAALAAKAETTAQALGASKEPGGDSAPTQAAKSQDSLEDRSRELVDAVLAAEEEGELSAAGKRLVRFLAKHPESERAWAIAASGLAGMGRIEGVWFRAEFLKLAQTVAAESPWPSVKVRLIPAMLLHGRGPDDLEAIRRVAAESKDPRVMRLALEALGRAPGAEIASPPEEASVPPPASAAEAPLRPGAYLGSAVHVYRTHEGRYQVYADKGTSASSFVFDQNTRKLRMGLTGPYDFELTGVTDQNGVRVYSYHYGGTFEPFDIDLSFGIDLASGDLVRLSSTIRVARWSTPWGWHSGPIKIVTDRLDL